MPINFETIGGYYDGQGIFHPNTGLNPSPIPGISYTFPIDPTKGYDILPDVQVSFPTFPNYEDVTNDLQQKIQDATGRIFGGVIGGFGTAIAPAIIFPAIVLGSAYIFRKDIKRLLK